MGDLQALIAAPRCASRNPDYYLRKIRNLNNWLADLTKTEQTTRIRCDRLKGAV
jgi:hypothetical protein